MRLPIVGDLNQRLQLANGVLRVIALVADSDGFLLFQGEWLCAFECILVACGNPRHFLLGE